MQYRKIQWRKLFNFGVQVMMKVGVPEAHAEMVSDNLVKSNLRGIDSHGVSRLKRYEKGVESGYIIPNVEPEIAKESGSLANVDGKNGLGQVTATFSMHLAIRKAKEQGISLVTAFNSNHYGFAGYYSMMALKHDLIGITMTNSSPLVVPTYSRNALFGTNPISLSAPTKKQRPWVMDLATSVAPRGKLELYNRLDKKLPDGWATDELGHPTNDPARVLRNLSDHLGGGLLPLGGADDLHGGHKGYGLIVMVDILTAIISGANYGPNTVISKNGKTNFPRIGHMFMVIDPNFFVGIDAFKERMDDYIGILKHAPKAEHQHKIWIHGEKEFEESERREKNGIPLDAKTVSSLLELSKRFDVEIEFEDSE